MCLMRRSIQLLALVVIVIATLASHAGAAAAAEVLLHLDVRTDTDDPDTEQRLRDAGFAIELSVPEYGRWQGWLPASRIAEFRETEGVVAVSAPKYAHFAAGEALTEGDEALNASVARSRFNVDGRGVRIAVISDGIAGLERAQLNGEAPKLADARAFGAGSLGSGQEGTAMIEIVHDLAPGADLYFAAVNTDLDLIAAVNHYSRYVDIIVDDVSFAFPANQLSDVSINTTRALENRDWPLRLYVTAAGNWAESHWSGEWRAGVDGQQLGLPSPGAVQWFNGDSSVNRESALLGAGNAFRVGHKDRIRLALFWDDDWGRSTNDYNLYLLSGVGEVLASSETRQGIGVNNRFSREHLEYVHEGESTELFAVIQNVNNDARAVRFDLFALNAGGAQPRLQYSTPAGSMLAQSDAALAITVGAVNVGEQEVASYSSRGPTANGAAKPEIAAVDRVTVSDTTSFAPQFTGSSAAAPHVAGVAALLLEAQPALLAANGGSPLLERRLIRDLLIDTALDIPPAGPDDGSGAGLVDAEAALHAAIDGLKVVTSAADSGPGSLREALSSGAEIVLLDDTQGGQVITLQSPLPPVPDGTVVDGLGWSIDASRVAVGLELGTDSELWGLRIVGATDVGVLLSGDRASLHGVELESNQIGVRVTGDNNSILETTVRNSETHGVSIDAAGWASISESVIEANGSAGVFVTGSAKGAHIGPPGRPASLSLAGSAWQPIDPLATPGLRPRSGLSLLVSGTVSVDGLPAAAGTTVSLYLDRRLAASVLVDADSRFLATVTGPGTEIRFSVNDVPVEQRLNFARGLASGHASLTLRAVSPTVSIGADRSGEHASLGNAIRDNRTGIEIESLSAARVGSRFVWGNEMRRNLTNIASPLVPPLIDRVSWSPAGLNLRGSAPGAAVAHLYAGPAAERRFAAAAPVIDDRFSFSDIRVHDAASHFSVIAHSADDLVSVESDVHRAGGRGRITSVTPEIGYIEGGESVRVCGTAIATDALAPKVWFGNQLARVSFWSGECVTVTTPPAAAGPVDIALLLGGARPVVGVDAFEYRNERIVKLRRGWNTVTWSGSATRASTAFQSLLGLNFRAYTWDAERQQWRIFATELPTRLNTLRSLSHDQPLWLYLDAADVDWLQPAPD